LIRNNWTPAADNGCDGAIRLLRENNSLLSLDYPIFIRYIPVAIKPWILISCYSTEQDDNGASQRPPSILVQRDER